MDGGLTYERLARLGLHRWWMPPVALAAAVSVAAVTACGLAGIGLLAAHAIGLNSADSESIGTPLLDNMLGLASLALLIPVTLGVARVVQRRPAGTLHSVAGRFRWPWFAVCLGLAFATAVLVMAALVLLYDGAADVRVAIDPWRFIGIVVVLVVLVLVLRLVTRHRPHWAPTSRTVGQQPDAGHPVVRDAAGVT